MRRILFGIVVALIVAGPLLGGTTYIDGSCTTGGDGTTKVCDGTDGPFLTIEDAVEENAPLTAGDTIRVKDSVTYSEAQVTTEDPGTASQPILLTRYIGESAPTWTGSNTRRFQVNHPYWAIADIVFDCNDATVDAIRVDSDHFTMRGIEMHNMGDGGDFVDVSEDGDHLEVEDCYFHDLDGGGNNHAIVTGKTNSAATYELDNIRIISNKFEDIGGDGIQLFEVNTQSEIPPLDSCREATVYGLIMHNEFIKGTIDLAENAIDVKTQATSDDPQLALWC